MVRDTIIPAIAETTMLGRVSIQNHIPQGTVEGPLVAASLNCTGLKDKYHPVSKDHRKQFVHEGWYYYWHLYCERKICKGPLVLPLTVQVIPLFLKFQIIWSDYTKRP